MWPDGLLHRGDHCRALILFLEGEEDVSYSVHSIAAHAVCRLVGHLASALESLRNTVFISTCLLHLHFRYEH
jgi:hypothetical protein